MALDPRNLPGEVTTFLTERHLATLTTLRSDNTPHVVAVGFTWDPDEQLVRVITFAPSRKARNVAERPGSAAAVCQVDGGRWLTLEVVAHHIVPDQIIRSQKVEGRGKFAAVHESATTDGGFLVGHESFVNKEAQYARV